MFDACQQKEQEKIFRPQYFEVFAIFVFAAEHSVFAAEHTIRFSISKVTLYYLVFTISLFEMSTLWTEDLQCEDKFQKIHQPGMVFPLEAFHSPIRIRIIEIISLSDND